MDESPEDPAPPPEIRFIKWLVTVLAGTMIAGVLLIVILLVIRLRDPGLTLPEDLALPEGARASAYTQGEGWVAVVTEAQEILIFDGFTGALRQTLRIAPGQ
ncbi:DUF6476 family protein [Roseivivax sp. CAU 1761]